MTATSKTDNPDQLASERLSIGISSCLLGERVRFDSGHKNHSYITKTLSDYFEFRPFCPEVAIGLGIPREPIRLVSDVLGGEVRCVGTKDPDKDVTAPLKSVAREQFEWIAGLDGYIFKKDSPSCGMERVKVYTKNMPERNGVGIYAAEILEAFPHLPVEVENLGADFLGLRDADVPEALLLVGVHPDPAAPSAATEAVLSSVGQLDQLEAEWVSKLGSFKRHVERKEIR